MTNKFNVGDKVERINNNYGQAKIGDIVTVTSVFYNTLQFEEVSGIYEAINFKLVQPKQFTKADLKDGMRVVYRNGEERYVLGDRLLERTHNGSYISASTLSTHKDDLSKCDRVNVNLDIMEVYERDGTLLWKREEKTQTQIEYEELQKTIKELQAKADSLGKLL